MALSDLFWVVPLVVVLSQSPLYIRVGPTSPKIDASDLFWVVPLVVVLSQSPLYIRVGPTSPKIDASDCCRIMPVEIMFKKTSREILHKYVWISCHGRNRGTRVQVY